MGRTKTERPVPEPITTLADIDEAIYHASRNPSRDKHWHRWVDALLDQRLRFMDEEVA